MSGRDAEAISICWDVLEQANISSYGRAVFGIKTVNLLEGPLYNAAVIRSEYHINAALLLRESLRHLDSYNSRYGDVMTEKNKDDVENWKSHAWYVLGRIKHHVETGSYDLRRASGSVSSRAIFIPEPGEIILGRSRSEVAIGELNNEVTKALETMQKETDGAAPNDFNDDTELDVVGVDPGYYSGLGEQPQEHWPEGEWAYPEGCYTPRRLYPDTRAPMFLLPGNFPGQPGTEEPELDLVRSDLDIVHGHAGSAQRVGLLNHSLPYCSVFGLSVTHEPEPDTEHPVSQDGQHRNDLWDDMLGEDWIETSIRQVGEFVEMYYPATSGAPSPSRELSGSTDANEKSEIGGQSDLDSQALGLDGQASVGASASNTLYTVQDQLEPTANARDLLKAFSAIDTHEGDNSGDNPRGDAEAVEEEGVSTGRGRSGMRDHGRSLLDTSKEEDDELFGSGSVL
jgi:hypothetical protein